MSKKKTHQEFIKEVQQLTNNEYQVLDEYINSTTKIKFKHIVCGNIFEMTPNSFLMGCRCPKCSSKQGHDKLSKKFMKTEEQFLLDIENKFNGKIIMIGEYIDSFTPIKFYCTKHQIYFINTPRNVYNSKTGCCPECALNKGEDCYKWKGGESELKDMVRHFDKEWQINTNDFYKHRCIITNKNTDIVIHHIWKSFADIYQELMDNLGYEYNTQRKNLSDKELEKIREYTILIHNKYGLGVPINRKLHEEFHKQYGTINNTPEQFIEFAKTKGVKLEIKMGEQGTYLSRIE